MRLISHHYLLIKNRINTFWDQKPIYTENIVAFQQPCLFIPVIMIQPGPKYDALNPVLNFTTHINCQAQKISIALQCIQISYIQYCIHGNLLWVNKMQQQSENLGYCINLINQEPKCASHTWTFPHLYLPRPWSFPYPHLYLPKPWTGYFADIFIQH